MEADEYHKAVQSISPKFVNILAVFAASVARKAHTFQCCAAAQHKSSMNEHPETAWLGIYKRHTSSLINKSVENLAHHLDQITAADSSVMSFQTRKDPPHSLVTLLIP